MLTVTQTLQNRYRIDALLGRGGMGAVYRAFDLRLQHVCVVKELLFEGGMSRDTEDAAAQFWQEARTLSNLSHPGLPRVTDYFQEGNEFFLVMDFIAGTNLSNLIGSGLPETTVLGFAIQLLDVLDYVHRQGVLHRDIKPANIIIQPGGRVTLVDFGLVKAVGGSMEATRPFLRGIGTPEYAPPEQFTGGTDQRSDIYSLGGLIYQALTGQPPAPAMSQLAGTALVPPRQLKPEITAATERAILKAMALNPALRFQTAAEFRSALQDDGPPTTPPTAAVRNNQPKDRLLIGGVVVLAVLLCITGLFVASQVLPLALNSGIPAVTSAPATRQPVQGATATPQPATPNSVVVTEPPVELTASPMPSPAPHVRSQIDPGNAAQVERIDTWKSGAVNQLAWSPDGSLVAGIGYRGVTIRLWRASDGSVVRDLTGHTAPVRGAAFSPDGSLLVSVGNDRTVRLWRVSDGRLVNTLLGHTNQVISVAFSPHGDMIASASDDKTVRLWRVSDGAPLRVLNGHQKEVVAVAFSPDGEKIASGSLDNTARVWKTSDGSLLYNLSGHTGWVWSLAFSPDGTLLATGSTDNTIRLWRMVDGALERALNGHTDFVLTVAFNPGGTVLASGGKDNSVRLWDVADGSQLQQLDGHTGLVGSVAFSPDGLTLGTTGADGLINLWGVYR